MICDTLLVHKTTGHISTGQMWETVPDLAEWVASAPFFAYGALVTIRVMQQNSDNVPHSIIVEA
jgi:hypothetical protein